MSLNTIFLMGRLTRDPELRRTKTDTAVTSFTIAVDRDYGGHGKEKVADFFDVVAWRTTAEFVSKYFTKGRMVVVEGSLHNRDWTDKDGNKRRTDQVLARNVYFGDSKRDDSAGSASRYGAESGYTPSAYTPGKSDFAEIGEEDEELPF